MKTEASINFNFNNAKRKAAELEEIAEQLKQIANNDLNGSFQKLSAAWKGEAANDYLKKGEQLRQKLIENARNLENTAATIRNIATRTYRAEMAAYTLAQQRKYNKK